MKRILILGSDYFDSANANGVCVRKLAEYLVALGHSVKVVSTSLCSKSDMVQNGVEISFVPLDKSYLRLMKMRKFKDSKLGRYYYKAYRLLRNIKLLTTYPLNYPARLESLIPHVESVINDYKIDTLICTCRPYDSIACGLSMKQRFGSKLYVVSYYLDNIVKDDTFVGIGGKIKKKRIQKAFSDELNLLNRVCLPSTKEEMPEWDSPIIHYVGFPLYDRPNSYESCNMVFDTNYTNVVYIGTLNQENRNPEKALKFFEMYNERFEKKIRFHIWGKVQDNSCKNLVERYSFVEYHGFIENKYTTDILKRCDYVINIANKVSLDFLPSKIFQLFALHLPIINFYYSEKDKSLQYFHSYSKAVNVYVGNDRPFDIKIISEKLIKISQIELTEDDEQFKIFTPEYICNELINN